MRNEVSALLGRAGTTVSAVASWLNPLGKTLPSEVAMIDLGLLQAVQHDYKHGLEAIHRQAALSGDRQARASEAELTQAFAHFRAALDGGDDAEAERLAGEVRDLAKRLARAGSAHDHPEKTDLKRVVAQREADQGALADAAGWMRSQDALARQPELLKATDRYAALQRQGQKNGASSEEALVQLLAALEPAGAAAPGGLRERIGEIVAKARAELERVRKVRETVALAVSGRGALKFVDNGSMGDATTTRQQTELLKRMLGDEAARSNVFAKLLEEVMDPRQPPLEMIAGRGSCALFDSFMEGSVDTTHFGILPADPVTVNNKKVGLTQGEILVHVLEERLYSRQRSKADAEHFGACSAYDHAHNKCLAPGSYQNLYRRERGVASDTLQLTEGSLRNGCNGFQHLASDGSVSTTPIAGINAPGFRPDPARFEYDAADRDGYELVMQRFRQGVEKRFRNGRLVDAEGRFQRAALPEEATRDWKLWLAEQLGDAARADAVVEAIVAELGAKYCGRAGERGARAPGLYAQEAVRVQRQDQQARQHLAARPDRALSPGSLALRRARQARGANINDAGAQYQAWQQRRARMSEEERNAEDKLQPKVSDTSRVNCAVTTLGAICACDSTAFVKQYFDLNRRGALKDTCGGLQGDDMWAFIEEGRPPEALVSETGHLREELNGDAQLRGIRKALLAEAQRRNGAGGPPSCVVQDGLNETGGMAAPDELLQRMAGYPDGTQFQVFVNGDMRHWVYAEMFDGQLVVEDYQMSSTGANAKPPQAKLATAGKPPRPAPDGMPDNPLSGLGGGFKEGMFLAIAPVADPARLPPRRTDPHWPEPGSAADRKLSATIAELATQATPAEFAAALRHRRADIEPAWCDAVAVADAIDAADAACTALRAVRGLTDGPFDSAVHFTRHAAAIPAIKAANQQLDRLLRARVVDKLRYPRLAPLVYPNLDDVLVEAMRGAGALLGPAGLDVLPFCAAYAAWKRLGRADRWAGEDQAAQAADILARIKAGIGGLDEASVPGLKQRLATLLLQTGIEAEIGRYRKRARLAAALPNARALVAGLQDPDALARELGRDELSEQELEAAAAERRNIQLDRAGLANRSAAEITPEQRGADARRLDEREDAASERKLLEKKKPVFQAAVASLGQAVRAIQDALPALAVPPRPDNDMTAVDAAREQMNAALAVFNDAMLVRQLNATVCDPLTEQIELRRPVAATAELDEFIAKLTGHLGSPIGRADPRPIREAVEALAALPDRTDMARVKAAIGVLDTAVKAVPKPMVRRPYQQFFEILPAALKP